MYIPQVLVLTIMIISEREVMHNYVTFNMHAHTLILFDL